MTKPLKISDLPDLKFDFDLGTDEVTKTLKDLELKIGPQIQIDSDVLSSFKKSMEEINEIVSSSQPKLSDAFSNLNDTILEFRSVMSKTLPTLDNEALSSVLSLPISTGVINLSLYESLLKAFSVTEGDSSNLEEEISTAKKHSTIVSPEFFVKFIHHIVIPVMLMMINNFMASDTQELLDAISKSNDEQIHEIRLQSSQLNNQISENQNIMDENEIRLKNIEENIQQIIDNQEEIIEEINSEKE